MIPYFLTRSNLADTLNFIVASAVTATKSGSADPARIRNCRTRPLGKRWGVSGPRLTPNGHGVTIPSPPYFHAPRPILFATMLSVLQEFGCSPVASAWTVRIGHTSIGFVAAFSLRGLHQATL